MATNVLIIVASLMSMVPNKWALFFGRFFYGMASGLMTVVVPKFIAEVSPLELKGSYGVVPQLMCVVG